MLYRTYPTQASRIYIAQNLGPRFRALGFGTIGRVSIQYIYRIGLVSRRVIGVRIICIGAYRDKA